MSAVGVMATMPLLHDVSHAFVPALFCLCIGTSSVFTGLNVLKMRAAKQLERCIRFPALYGGAVDLDDLLKRVLYPKIKGQRGGGFVWSDVERTQIDVLAGNIKPKRSKPMKKLKQFTKLFNLRHRRRNSKSSNKQVKNEYVLSPKMDVEEEAEEKRNDHIEMDE